MRSRNDESLPAEADFLWVGLTAVLSLARKYQDGCELSMFACIVMNFGDRYVTTAGSGKAMDFSQETAELSVSVPSKVDGMDRDSNAGSNTRKVLYRRQTLTNPRL
jgi:hypothetical protein